MAQANKNLVNLNDELRFDIPTDDTAIIGVQYPVGGLGTIVLEGTMDAGVSWFTIQLLSPSGGAGVLLLAAAGQGYADVSYCDWVRIRKSVAGGGGCNVSANLSTRSAN